MRLGQDVLYVLGDKEARHIGVMTENQGLTHVAGYVRAGFTCAAKIVKVHTSLGGAPPKVNLQVFIDGNFTIWVTDVSEGAGIGRFR